MEWLSSRYQFGLVYFHRDVLNLITFSGAAILRWKTFTQWALLGSSTLSSRVSVEWPIKAGSGEKYSYSSQFLESITFNQSSISFNLLGLVTLQVTLPLNRDAFEGCFLLQATMGITVPSLAASHRIVKGIKLVL